MLFAVVVAAAAVELENFSDLSVPTWSLRLSLA